MNTDRVAEPAMPAQARQAQDDLIADLMHDSTQRGWDLPVLNDAAGVDQRWRRAFVVFRVADLLAKLETALPIKSLSVEDRAWLKGQVQALVDDVEVYFQAPQDDGSHYQPEQEPDDFDEVRR